MPERLPRLAGIALQGHRGHRAIGARSEAAVRAAKLPRPSRATGMTAMSASPSPSRLPTTTSAMKRG